MAFKIRIDRDSITPTGEHRLTTFQLEFPRLILAEVNTHTVLSKNASSSRAIPVRLMLEKVKQDPYVPIFWGKNQKGMQAFSLIDSPEEATEEWLATRDLVIARVERLIELGAHKQEANRLLEPWNWTRQVITGTNWANFFAQRTHETATHAFQFLAKAMYIAYRRSQPKTVSYGEWHLPFTRPEDEELAKRLNPDGYRQLMCKWSVARCARVSYETFESKKPSPEDDSKLYDDLVNSWPKHMSPTQHQGTPMLDGSKAYSGNFCGWVQYRKTIPGECVEEFNPSDEEIASWEIPESVFTNS